MVGEVERRDLSDVVLACHSWGGYPATGAAHRLVGRVAKVIYFSAVVPERGRSMLDENEQYGEMIRQAIKATPRRHRPTRPRRRSKCAHARRPPAAPATREPAAAAAAGRLYDRQPRPAAGHADRSGRGIRAMRRRQRPGPARNRVRGAARRRPAGDTGYSHDHADQAGHGG
ncbi:alpha/beta fold hydrolase [Streptomyces sp. NPDC059697]|uniref:alpha/beta fold hydrolase n=1 Tax=Streptomyces sp. NPDC059697 TaxID=3346912 RepID=UPI0036BB603F